MAGGSTVPLNKPNGTIVAYYGNAASCIKHLLDKTDWIDAMKRPDAALWSQKRLLPGVGMTDAPRPSRQLSPIDFIENRRARERMGLPPAPPYPRPLLGRLIYGDTPYHRRMVALEAKRESARRAGRYPD